jgi:hypothetical protein
VVIKNPIIIRLIKSWVQKIISTTTRNFFSINVIEMLAFWILFKVGGWLYTEFMFLIYSQLLISVESKFLFYERIFFLHFKILLYRFRFLLKEFQQKKDAIFVYWSRKALNEWQSTKYSIFRRYSCPLSWPKLSILLQCYTRSKLKLYCKSVNHHKLEAWETCKVKLWLEDDIGSQVKMTIWVYKIMVV